MIKELFSITIEGEAPPLGAINKAIDIAKVLGKPVKLILKEQELHFDGNITHRSVEVQVRPTSDPFDILELYHVRIKLEKLETNTPKDNEE
jgi:hypothetical protein